MRKKRTQIKNKHAPLSRKKAYDAFVSITEPTKTTDAFSNPMARLGYGTQNLLEATEYPLTRLTQNFHLLNSLYRTNWIVQNIISMIPEDALKKWFTITSNVSPEHLDKIKRLQRITKLRESVKQGMKWGRLYGGAVGLILIAGQENLAEPLNYDLIMPDSFKGLFIVDRWSGVYPSLKLIDDMTDPDFGLPEYYEIRDERGIARYTVHHSRVIRFLGRKLPYFEEIAEQYWGQSEIEAVYEEIVKRDNVSNNMASLTFKANLSVYEMDNVDQMFSIGGTEAQRRFWNMMQAQSVLESNMGTRVIKRGDKISQLQYTFTGLAEMYEAIQHDVSGACHIPVTKLFGRSPAGMNATGESDQENYDDYIDEIRESDVRPIIEKLLPIMALSAWGEIPADLDFEFPALRTPTETEKAQIAKEKTMPILEAFNNHTLTLETTLIELRKLAETTGMFTSITNEMIAYGKDVWISDINEKLNDPLAGIITGETDLLEKENEVDAGADE